MENAAALVTWWPFGVAVGIAIVIVWAIVGEREINEGLDTYTRRRGDAPRRR